MKRILLAAAAAVIVSACGGGDSAAPSSTTAPNTPPPTTPPPTTPPPTTPPPTTPPPTTTPPPSSSGPAGLYIGTGHRNYERQLLFLDDGTVWGVVGTRVDSVLYVHGMIQGKGTLSGEVLTGSLNDYSIWAGRESGAFTATFASDSLNWSRGGAAQTTLKKSSAYDYNRAADASELAGTWTGKTMDGAGTRVTISSSGELTGSSSGCEFAGSAVPQSGGRNVFTVTLTTGQMAACDFLAGGTWWTRKNESITGIAITYPLANGERQLMVAVQNGGSPYLGAGFIATNAAAAALPPVVRIAEPLGLYVGSTSFGDDIQVLNLENGIVWGVYSRMQNSVRQVRGFFHQRSDGLYEFPTYTTFGFDGGRNYTMAGEVTKFFVLGFFKTDDFNALLVNEVPPATFALITKRSNEYDYNRAADLNALAATWTGASLDGGAATITVSPGGGVTGSSGGCSFTGTASPRAGGKNVFDLSVTLGSAPCARPGTLAAGFAITYPSGTGQKAVLAAESAARDFGVAFVLEK